MELTTASPPTGIHSVGWAFASSTFEEKSERITTLIYSCVCKYDSVLWKPVFPEAREATTRYVTPVSLGTSLQCLTRLQTACYAISGFKQVDLTTYDVSNLYFTSCVHFKFFTVYQYAFYNLKVYYLIHQDRKKSKKRYYLSCFIIFS